MKIDTPTNKRLPQYVVMSLLILCVSCCHNPTLKTPTKDEMHIDNEANAPNEAEPATSRNGIYYWKTVFRLTRWERNFLKQHQIDQLYIRLFDVDRDYERQMPVPVATTRFADSIPAEVSVVPVVYITTSGLEDICDYDTLFYRRIKAMAQRNGFRHQMKEIQLDCDWTRSNQIEYFTFCQRIRQLAQADGIRLSSTIRLHQLRSEAPPVDSGVLMLYNTGSIYNLATENSILSSVDVKPYLTRHIDYALPLSAAYPTYAWGILLRGQKFAAILHKSDFTDRSLYRPCGGNIYKVIAAHYLENHHLQIGDRIRVEHSLFNEIQTVRGYVEASLGIPVQNIIYHLDSLNLSNYSASQIQTILQ